MFYLEISLPFQTQFQNWYTYSTLKESLEIEHIFLITCIKWLALDILCRILDISFVELDILSSSGFAKLPFSWNEVEAAEAEFRGMVCCWMVFSRSPTFSRVSNRPAYNKKGLQKTDTYAVQSWAYVYTLAKM